MISVENLTIRIGRTVALKRFSGSFAPGTVTALVGGDGAGKSSLLRRLAVPLHNRKHCVTGMASVEVGYQPARSGVWMNMSVAENLEFVRHAYGLQKHQSNTRISKLLHVAQLDGVESRLGSQLSGGMRQKLGVIMAMVHRPDLLLLDEPTTGVDQQSRAQLWALIRQAADEGATVVMATTYLDEAEQADQTYVLDKGRTISQGSPAEVIGQAPGLIVQQRANGESLPSDDVITWQRGHEVYRWLPDRSAKIPEGMVESAMDLELATIATMLASQREDDEELDWSALNLPTLDLDEHLIEAEAITHQFGSFQVLRGVDLLLDSGEIIGLIGGNGAGKSTLIRIILGLLQPSSGSVRLFEQAPNHQARARIGYVPQSLGLYATLTPKENLAFTLDTFRVPTNGGLTELALAMGNELTGQLSLGTQRNLAVICALSHHPQLLILDEPTSGMDPLSRAQLWKVLRKAANQGMGILVTTHYQQEAIQCDRLVHLDRGRVVAAAA